MAPRDPKDGGRAGGGGGGAADPEADIEAPLLASSGSSFFLDPAGEDGDEEQRSRRRRFLLGSHAQSNTTSQVALVGADVCPIQSLDYELIENDVFKQDWRARGRDHILRYVALKWVLCFLVGALAAAAGFVANLGVENVAGAKFVVTSNLMLDGKHGSAFAVFLASNFALTMLAAVLTVFVAPAAAGSGIPEVKAYLNGVDAPNIFSLKTLIVKIPLNLLYSSDHFYEKWRSALLWRAFFTTAMVAVVLRALIDFCKSGKCGLFGKGGLIMFDVTADYVTYHLVDLPPVITLGVFGGILGSLYNFFLDKVLRLYNLINEKGKTYKLLLAATVTRAPVVGILTRHDFMPEHILGLHPFLFKSRWKKAVLWLEEYLPAQCKSTLIVVSHEEGFLNAVRDEILHFEDKKLHAYRGNFDAFVRSYEQRKATTMKEHEKLAKAARKGGRKAPKKWHDFSVDFHFPVPTELPGGRHLLRITGAGSAARRCAMAQAARCPPTGHGVLREARDGNRDLMGWCGFEDGDLGHLITGRPCRTGLGPI
ncbi:hypothetical protein C2845_PM15G23270 [Panicum miliaceum]|uniref:ABC transporter domain-containing protein n=1 Tax=Panicum miliaceum TaxID=4540 RepID=A0A3L6Q6I3_PANMI|nr:hypothetical protein C2845_PM15G23270 [Panicum miliaceum]